jgi:hypothetical protein
VVGEIPWRNVGKQAIALVGVQQQYVGSHPRNTAIALKSEAFLGKQLMKKCVM